MRCVVKIQCNWWVRFKRNSTTLAYIESGKPNDEQIDLLTNSIEILVGVLGAVVSGIEQERH